MKLDINIDSTVPDLQISISCSALTPELEKVLAILRILDRQLTASKDKETFLLNPSDIIYIEAVERKCFLYTGNDVYESSLKLYELEQQLEGFYFIRVSKSCIVNLKAIQSLRTDLNHRIRITLNNGEQIIASRQYADELKRRIGVI